ncbi:MAG: hypothetical protein ACRDZY_18425, partial [Acidimicrobiales bacterium]
MPPSPLDHSGEVDAPAGVPRAGEPGSAAGRPARRWLVDGMNVVGCEPDGWWRDRPRAMADLAGELAGFGRDLGEEVTVVF